MKRTLFLLMIAIFAVTLVFPGAARAQTNTGQTTWTSSIYYYNPSGDPAGGKLQVSYIGKDSSDTSKDLTGNSTDITVKPHGSGEVFIGETTVPSGFKGSAILYADIPIVAVYEQAPNSNPNFARLLYSAFEASQASATVYVPTFVNNTKAYQSQVGIQAISGNNPINVRLKFYNADGTPKGEVYPLPIAPQTSYIFPNTSTATEDLAKIPVDGSLVIEADTAGNPDAKVVAAVEEMQPLGRRAYAFEGISVGATRVYMPAMQCKNGHGSQTSYYSIQNLSDQPNSVTVKAYLENTGTLLNPTQAAISIPANGKASVNACSLRNTLYKAGSAVIESTQPVAVVGKATGTDGLATSFVGVPKTDTVVPSTHVVLPYATWFTNLAKGYRAYISVQNAGSAPASDVQVKFYRNDWKTEADTKTVVMAAAGSPLAPGARRTTDPYKAKALRIDGNYRGAVEVISDQPVVVIVRMERKVSGVSGYGYFGEDYIGSSNPLFP